MLRKGLMSGIAVAVALLLQHAWLNSREAVLLVGEKACANTTGALDLLAALLGG